MYCQLKYVKHQYLSTFKGYTKIQIILSFLGSLLIYLELKNTLSDKSINYIMIICLLIPFIAFYIKGIKYCKEK